MKCYFHPKTDAVGICSVCFKAVCKDCVGDDEPELVCKNCMRVGLKMLKEERRGNTQNEKPIFQKNRPQNAKQQYTQNKNNSPGILSNLFKQNKNLNENNIIDSDVITPVLFIGILAGILCGVPVLSLLFFIIMPIAGILSIVYLKAEQDYKTNIGIKKGIITGILVGILASIVSLIVIISLGAFLGVQIYGLMTNIFGFLDTNTLNTLITISGGDATLSLNGIITRLFITIISFPILSGFFGLLGAKFLR
ncbi:MAG: hypothetical protein WC356_03035 [Candidatus Micrarchaeia archaeon]